MTAMACGLQRMAVTQNSHRRVRCPAMLRAGRQARWHMILLLVFLRTQLIWVIATCFTSMRLSRRLTMQSLPYVLLSQLFTSHLPGNHRSWTPTPPGCATRPTTQHGWWTAGAWPALLLTSAPMLRLRFTVRTASLLHSFAWSGRFTRESTCGLLPDLGAHAPSRAHSEWWLVWNAGAAATPSMSSSPQRRDIDACTVRLSAPGVRYHFCKAFTIANCVFPLLYPLCGTSPGGGPAASPPPCCRRRPSSPRPTGWRPSSARQLTWT